MVTLFKITFYSHYSYLHLRGCIMFLPKDTKSLFTPILAFALYLAIMMHYRREFESHLLFP